MRHPTRLLVTACIVLSVGWTGRAGAQPTIEPVDVAKDAGVHEITRTFSVNPVDYNDDWSGFFLDDFFLVRHDPQRGLTNLPTSTLYRNVLGGTYVDGGTAMFGKTDKHGCAWGDYNNDDLMDMACAIGFGQFSKNELWRQNPGGTFTNVAGALGITARTHGRYRYVTFIDANDDGNQDLYFARYYGPSVAQDPESPSYYPGDEWPNELRLNRGPDEGYAFRNAPEFGLNVLDGSRKDANACAQAVDYDDDGDEDLLVCGETSLKLYRNNSPVATFSNVSSSSGAAQGAIRDATIVDLDRDGVYELVRLTDDMFWISTRTDNLDAWTETSYSLALSEGESLATGDFNRDGLSDIFVVAKKGKDPRDDPDFLVIQTSDRLFEARNLGTVDGSGDDVAAVDYNRDGSADFIVSNGDKRRAGPVQLWTNQATPPNCLGRQPTLVGSVGDDIIEGTNASDVIVGLGGQDTIHGLGGDDVICSGGGEDLIEGDRGHDLINGQGGADRLLGEKGADEVRGGRDGDDLDGGPGSDALVGGPGVDHVLFTGGQGVVADLSSGTARGDGADSLRQIENVEGTAVCRHAYR